MRAVVYHGPGDRRLENVPDPRIEDPKDVIVRVSTSTICGTDLHILPGDVPTIRPGTVLGHEGVGVVEEAGTAVRRLRKGDRVIVPALSACGVCKSCKRQMAFFCQNGGGWLVGHLANGLQAQYTRVPLADTSLHVVPAGLEDVDVLFLTDSIPTGYECGIETGRLRPGETLAVVGAGPVGLSAVVTSRLHGPRLVISIDPDENRLEVARQLGADHAINPSRQDAREEVLRLTDGGVDLAVEAVACPRPSTSASLDPRRGPVSEPRRPWTADDPASGGVVGQGPRSRPRCSTATASRCSSPHPAREAPAARARHPRLHPRSSDGSLRRVRRSLDQQGDQGDDYGLSGGLHKRG